MRDDDDWDDDEDDDDDVPCPYCGASMYEEAGYCSACDRWISAEDKPSKSMPAWMVLIILLLVAVFVLSALRGF